MSLKNLLIKWLVSALQPVRKRSQLHGAPSRFLIISTTGLGDTLWAEPALRSLRGRYPDSQIAVLTTELGEKIFSRMKGMDEIIVLEKPLFWNALRLLPRLRAQQFDALFIFHTSQRFILPFCSLLDVPKIIGTKGLQKGLDFLLTDALENQRVHEIERRLALVQKVGAQPSTRGLDFSLHQSDEEEVAQFLLSRNVPDHLPLICLHPGAKNLFKQWPARCFIEVGRRLSQHTGSQIIVSGDSSEAPLVYEIASHIPDAVPFAGELSLGAFAALLKRCALMITNDTGPMHLAFAMKTPTVALFGPTDPAVCGPWHAEFVEVIHVGKTCTPCLKKKCEEPFCLLQIGPDRVYDRALKLFFRLVEQL